MSSSDKFRIAVLISGSGSTLKNVCELCGRGILDAEVCGVIASRKCSGLDYAGQYGVPKAVVRRGKPFDAADFAARMTKQLDEWSPDLIVFGGFLSLYLIPEHYQFKTINIHPALLPFFGGKGMYGDRVHEAVLKTGMKLTGCTVHFVDNEYDHGAIIAQRAVPVLDDDTVDTLGERVRAEERKLYPAVIGWFAGGRVTLDSDGRVRVSGNREIADLSQ